MKNKRHYQAIGIAEEIQERIDKLKELNFSIDMNYNSLNVYDDKIKPKKQWINDSLEYDYNNGIVYSFITSRKS